MRIVVHTARYLDFENIPWQHAGDLWSFLGTGGAGMRVRKVSPDEWGAHWQVDYIVEEEQ